LEEAYLNLQEEFLTEDETSSPNKKVVRKTKKDPEEIEDAAAIKNVREYLKFYYKRRESVAKCYTMRQFTAGACSTQRVESINSIINKNIRMARRSIFLKLVDLFKNINSVEDFHVINLQRHENAKTEEADLPLFKHLVNEFSKHVIKQVKMQLEM